MKRNLACYPLQPPPFVNGRIKATSEESADIFGYAVVLNRTQIFFRTKKREGDSVLETILMSSESMIGFFTGTRGAADTAARVPTTIRPEAYVEAKRFIF